MVRFRRQLDQKYYTLGIKFVCMYLNEKLNNSRLCTLSRKSGLFFSSSNCCSETSSFILEVLSIHRISYPLREDIFSLMILRLSLVMFVPSRMATSPPLKLHEKGKGKERERESERKREREQVRERERDREREMEREREKGRKRERGRERRRCSVEGRVSENQMMIDTKSEISASIHRNL